MQRQTLSFLAALLVLVFLGACGGSDTSGQAESAPGAPAEEPAASVQDPLLTMQLNSVEAIDEWLELTTMKADAGGMTATEPKTLSRGDMTYQGVLRQLDGVQMIQIGSPSWTDLNQGFRYFLRDGEVVALEEVKKLEDGSYQINTFYYDNGQLLKGTSRAGATAKDARQSIEVTPYESPYGDLDFRLKYQEVKMAANQFLNDLDS